MNAIVWKKNCTDFVSVFMAVCIILGNTSCYSTRTLTNVADVPMRDNCYYQIHATRSKFWIDSPNIVNDTLSGRKAFKLPPRGLRVTIVHFYTDDISVTRNDNGTIKIYTGDINKTEIENIDNMESTSLGLVAGTAGVLFLLVGFIKFINWLDY